MQRIDGPTAAQVRACITKSAQRGSDVVRALDELGLLWYPGKQDQVTAAVLGSAAKLLEQLSMRDLAATVIPGVPRNSIRLPTSPLDTKSLIVQWLRAQEREVRG